MSNTELNFKVILAAIHPSAVEAKDAIASLLASAFNTSVQQTRSFLEKLPVVLFENLTTNDVKAIKDHLIFFSKLGLDFNITPKAITNIPRANWTPKIALPVITCPSCGEMFYLMRSQDIHQQIHQTNKPPVAEKPTQTAPTPTTSNKQVAQLPAQEPPKETKAMTNKGTPPKAPPPLVKSPVPSTKEKSTKADEDSNVVAEMEEIDVLSAELQSIVDMEEKPEKGDVEEIEEVGSISEELSDVGSVSEELRKISLDDENSKLPTVSKPVSAKAPPIKVTQAPTKPNLPELKSAPIQPITNKPPKKNQDIEEIGGISAEFEEIEGVSAEFERICLEGMDGDIGSLSAEFEEIEGGMSSEIEGIKNEEKISEIPQPMKNIASSNLLLNDKKRTSDQELDELQGISQELDEIADTASIKKPAKTTKTEAIDAKQIKQGESLKPVPKTMPMKASVPSETTKPLPNMKPGQTSNKTDPIEPGNCKVILNFTGKASKEVIQLLSQTKNITTDQAKSLTESTATVIAASGISLKSAQNILKQFQNLQVQGRISTI